MKIFFSVLAVCTLFSCSQCVECNGEKFCKQNGATYTDGNGNSVSWDEYAEEIEAQCQ